MHRRCFLDGLNYALSKFLGLDNAEFDVSTPHSIIYDGNNVLVIVNEPHKRHRIIEDWEYFYNNTFKKLDCITKNKLETALGEAIASDLIVSFNEISKEY